MASLGCLCTEILLLETRFSFGDEKLLHLTSESIDDPTQLEWDCVLREEQIESLTAMLEESDSDRAARGEQIQTLTAMLVHGRNSVKFDSVPPTVVPAGTVVRCMHELKLDVEAGEYKLEVGFAELPEPLFSRRHRYAPSDIAPQIRLLCHVSGAVAISVINATERYPCLFSHYGLVDLPGNQQLTLLPANAVESEGTKRL